MAQSWNTFGPGNRGIQVGQSYGPITTVFHLPERPETPPQPSINIPFIRDPRFIERGDLLDQIAQRLREPPARVALAGFGGFGNSKSQLAIEYAYRFSDENPDTWVFWIHAATRARFEEDFRTIADLVKLPGRQQAGDDLPRLIRLWLSSQRNGRWLLILDSADDADLLYKTEGGSDARPLAAWLPQTRNGSIIVTTRNKDLGRRLAGQDAIVDIGVMSESESLQLLEGRLGGVDDIERPTAMALIEALENIPLAISQAGGYIRAKRPRTSLREYLAELQQDDSHGNRLLTYDGGELGRDVEASNAVVTTWQISFKHIRAKRPSAADLISLMSFFDRQGIPESCLKPLQDEGSGDVTDSNDEQQDIGYQDTKSIDLDSNVSCDDPDDEFEKDLSQLRDFCLIIVNEDRHKFDMHRLVQLSTRAWLKQHGEQTRFIQQCVKRLFRVFPTEPYDNLTECQQLFPHVELALGYQVDETKFRMMQAKLLFYGGWYAYLQGRYDVAEFMAYKARCVRDEEFRTEDEATSDSISLLGDVLRSRGQWDKAEELQVQVLEARKTRLGADHIYTLDSISNLASTYRIQGRWNEAEALETQVLEARRTKFGADYPDTLNSMNDLALIYQDQGRYSEAEELQVQVLEARKTKLGADHLYTLSSMANLASAYSDQGRWDEAEGLQVQVLETYKAKFGADHPDTLTSMANLASTYWSQGRWDEAEKLGVQVLDARKTKFGVDHPDVLTSMGNLALTYWSQDRWDEAEKLGVQVLDIRKTKSGVDHPDTLTSMANLALIYRSQGRWDEAEKLRVQVLDARKTKLGVDHPHTLRSMSQLAYIWKDLGQHDDALALMRRCAQGRQCVLGPDHPDTKLAFETLKQWSDDTSIDST
ncbi:TPR-like protein [Pleurostoma richardsiae]|uniref:TPR-like protein n=1 Tax=Pleurostoma richardsiae TaxID=41990 RepID=A0AA38VZ06_9PEZI|nr:TPR-like protein [Pleurostoma richardsiae]